MTVEATIEHFVGSTTQSSALAPAGNARREWPRREGILLRLTASDGLIGQGEASPLPGYSSDLLPDCAAALRAVPIAEASEVLAQAEPHAILDWVPRAIPESLPAARFALETALLDLLAQRRCIPLYALLRSGAEQSIPVAALLVSESTENALQHAMALFERGVRTFKVKVGHVGCFTQECELLAALRARFGDTVRLRLDANRAFAVEGLVECLTTLSAFEPEYVEEPCDPESLLDRDPLPVPIAFDETLAEPRWRDPLRAWLQRHPGAALVLKPMVLGGFSACLRWSKVASQARARVVLSHAFDGPVALTASAHLALALDCDQGAAGLMPHAGLSVWPPVELPLFGGGSIQPTNLPGLGLEHLVSSEGKAR